MLFMALVLSRKALLGGLGQPGVAGLDPWGPSRAHLVRAGAGPPVPSIGRGAMGPWLQRARPDPLRRGLSWSSRVRDDLRKLRVWGPVRLAPFVVRAGAGDGVCHAALGGGASAWRGGPDWRRGRMGLFAPASWWADELSRPLGAPRGVRGLSCVAQVCAWGRPCAIGAQVAFDGT